MSGQKKADRGERYAERGWATFGCVGDTYQGGNPTLLDRLRQILC